MSFPMRLSSSQDASDSVLERSPRVSVQATSFGLQQKPSSTAASCDLADLPTASLPSNQPDLPATRPTHQEPSSAHHPCGSSEQPATRSPIQLDPSPKAHQSSQSNSSRRRVCHDRSHPITASSPSNSSTTKPDQKTPKMDIGILDLDPLASSSTTTNTDTSASSSGGPSTQQASSISKSPAMSKKRAREASTPKKTPTKRRASPPAAAPTPARGRSARARKPVARYVDEQAAAVTKPKPKPAARGSRVFDPVYMTSDSRSRLVKTDIYHLLMEQSAWTSLSDEQQSRLVSLLPPTAANVAAQAALAGPGSGSGSGTGAAGGVQRPKELSLGFEPFRSDVSAFKTDLGNGQYGKAWLAQAEQAVVDRAEGKFDAWKEEETEAWWGQKMK